VAQQVAGQGVGAGLAQAAVGALAQQGGVVGAAGQVAQQVASGQGVVGGVAQAALGAVAQSASGQAAATLMVNRMARLLSQPDSNATVLAELKPGMLAYPTGGRNGGMIEIDDEMGNRGWLPAVVLGAKG